jgi:hypothetical protein
MATLRLHGARSEAPSVAEGISEPAGVTDGENLHGARSEPAAGVTDGENLHGARSVTDGAS